MEILKLLYQNKIGAIGAITLGVLGLGICYGMWSWVIITAVDVLITYIIWKKDISLIYFIELGSLIMLMSGLLFSIFK